MAIYFVRHGQDEEGYRGGWSQRGLIDEGIRQAEKLGNTYMNIIMIIISIESYAAIYREPIRLPPYWPISLAFRFLVPRIGGR